MDSSHCNGACWAVVIIVIAIAIIIAGFIIIEMRNPPKYSANVGWGNSGNHLCDYGACCSIYPADRAWGCDSQGCEATIPNWTHPNCNGGGP
ncbi:MAG: hypothetical protein WC998_09970 [Candidatus Paceibacterota bacterium]